jgi:hypothetical protein
MYQLGLSDTEETYMAATTLFTCLCGVEEDEQSLGTDEDCVGAGITFMPWD